MAGVVSNADVVQRFIGTSTKSVRSTRDPLNGRPLVNASEFFQSLGMPYSTAQRKCEKAARSNEFSQKMIKLYFEPNPGQTQNHPAWATDADTLYKIAMDQKPKYSQTFRDFAAQTATGTLGGSEGLQQCVASMRDVQQQLTENHPLRVFGRDAEHKDSMRHSNVSRDVVRAKDRLDACESTKMANSAAHANLADADKAYYVNKNVLVYQAATHQTPKQAREHFNVKNARDVLGIAQLRAASLAESIAEKRAEESKTADEALKKLAEDVKILQNVTRIIKDDFNTTRMNPTAARQTLALPAPTPLQITGNNYGAGTVNYYFGK